MTQRPNRPRFPGEGIPRERILADLAEMQAGDVPAHGSRNLRPNYYVDDEILALIDEVSARVAEQNVLYAGSSYPSIARIEAELVEMGEGFDLGVVGQNAIEARAELALGDLPRRRAR